MQRDASFGCWRKRCTNSARKPRAQPFCRQSASTCAQRASCSLAVSSMPLMHSSDRSVLGEIASMHRADSDWTALLHFAVLPSHSSGERAQCAHDLQRLSRCAHAA